MLMRCSPVIIALCLMILHTTCRAAGADSADEQLLQSAGIRTDGPSLLELFRNRASTTADPQHLETLIRQLNDPSFVRREKAAGELIALGTSAIPLLRQSVKDVDQPRSAEEALR